VTAKIQCKEKHPGIIHSIYCFRPKGHSGNHKSIMGTWNDNKKEKPMKPKKPKEPFTKFGPWFKAQFGRDIMLTQPRHELEQKAGAAQQKASRLERQCSEEDRFDYMHDAALKGWVAGYEACKRELGKP
jgi:hypothetical protein